MQIPAMAETYSAEHLKGFYADSLAILEIMERLNKDVTPSFLGKYYCPLNHKAVSPTS